MDKVPQPDKIAHYIASLQLPDGSFMGDQYGEIDTRFSYCALSTLSILGKLEDGHINKDAAVDFVARYNTLYFTV